MLKLITNNKSSSYDPLVPDAYILRAVSVGDGCNIFAAEDIYNAKDILLAPKDILITPELANILCQQRLKRPIENSLRLEHELNATELEKHFISILQTDDLLSSINEHQDIIPYIRYYLTPYEKFPALKQKITIMALTLPEVFLRTIYCSWFALLIAKEMKFSERGCVDVFLAALSHDIGMLHLNTYVLDKKSEMSPEDWRHIQEHVFIGAQLLKQMPGMSSDVIEAVYEHHERCDGTGYPKGKVESELTYAGKIVGLADSLIAIYRNRFQHQQRNWRDVIPVIQMNAQAYFYRHDEILATIWRRSQMPFKNIVQGDDFPEFVSALFIENERLNSWFEILRDSLLSIGFTHGDRRLHALQNIMLHVTTSVKGSGVFSAELEQWLSDVELNNEEDSYRKIERAHIQQQEILFHLQRLNRMLQFYLESDHFKKIDIKEALLKTLDRVKRFST
ncbi:MAG: HD domain-containing protein [Gammaproteobacteria bacterium]|nr:MAG: HD domain-containing protein [Gammaproteobacteria bacterium]